jgi:hypothetical protein
MKKTPDVTFRVSGLLRDPTNSEQAIELAKLWRENYRFTAELSSKALQRLLFLALLFTLLSTASLAESTVFGLKFQRVDAPLALCYLASGFLFYRVLSLFSFSQLLESVLRYYYERAYPAWHRESLTVLTHYPGISNLEFSLGSLENSGSWFSHISDWWGFGTPILLILTLLVWFIWAGTIVGRELPALLAVAVLMLTALFILRGVLVVLHTLYRV